MPSLTSFYASNAFALISRISFFFSRTSTQLATPLPVFVFVVLLLSSLSAEQLLYEYKYLENVQCYLSNGWHSYCALRCSLYLSLASPLAAQLSPLLATNIPLSRCHKSQRHLRHPNLGFLCLTGGGATLTPLSLSVDFIAHQRHLYCRTLLLVCGRV